MKKHRSLRHYPSFVTVSPDNREGVSYSGLQPKILKIN